MKPRKGWLLTRERVPPGNVASETLAVIIPSRKVTNKVVDDIVREHHLKEFGRLWPSKVSWRAPPDIEVLTLKTPLATYRLSRVEIFG